MLGLSAIEWIFGQ